MTQSKYKLSTIHIEWRTTYFQSVLVRISVIVVKSVKSNCGLTDEIRTTHRLIDCHIDQWGCMIFRDSHNVVGSLEVLDLIFIVSQFPSDVWYPVPLVLHGAVDEHSSLFMSLEGSVFRRRNVACRLVICPKVKQIGHQTLIIPQIMDEQKIQGLISDPT